MKTMLRLVIAAALCLGAVSHVSAEKAVGGPRGGRLLDTTPTRAEFVVTPDQRGEVVFYDAALQPVAPTSQLVTLTAETAAGRVAVDLESTATGFISKQPLPPGAPYRVVVQVRAGPGERPQNHRIDLNLATCGECARPEYACTCEGH